MRTTFTVVAAAMLAVFSPSCAVINPPVERIPFPEAEYAALVESGTAVVSGQAFLKTLGGDVKTAAGEEVLLNPVTSYSEQWYENSYLGGKPMTESDPRYSKYMRRTIADGDGRFSFAAVPRGEYFVVARVVWAAPTGYGLAPQGGFVAKRITVAEGETLSVIVTR